jgi:hypothetical protein
MRRWCWIATSRPRGRPACRWPCCSGHDRGLGNPGAGRIGLEGSLARDRKLGITGSGSGAPSRGMRSSVAAEPPCWPMEAVPTPVPVAIEHLEATGMTVDGPGPRLGALAALHRDADGTADDRSPPLISASRGQRGSGSRSAPAGVGMADRVVWGALGGWGRGVGGGGLGFWVGAWGSGSGPGVRSRAGACDRAVVPGRAEPDTRARAGSRRTQPPVRSWAWLPLPPSGSCSAVESRTGTLDLTIRGLVDGRSARLDPQPVHRDGARWWERASSPRADRWPVVGDRIQAGSDPDRAPDQTPHRWFCQSRATAHRRAWPHWSGGGGNHMAPMGHAVAARPPDPAQPATPRNRGRRRSPDASRLDRGTRRPYGSAASAADSHGSVPWSTHRTSPFA